MVDQPFLTWAFPASGTGAVDRSLPDRLSEFVNVKDYGVTGDGSTDDVDAINAVLTNTADGATIYFPPGDYAIGSSIVLPDDQAARRLIGSGSNKTRILGGFDNYLLYNALNRNGNKPVSLIDGFSFINSYSLPKASFTSPDPIDEEDGDPTGACGCIYLPNSSWVAIKNCDFTLNSGVGVYAPGLANNLDTFNINGNFGGVITQPITIGVWTVAHISNGKIMGCRYGIVNLEQPGYIKSMDIERCQVGIRLGKNPYSYWDRNTHSIFAANSILAHFQTVDGIIFESCGSVEEGGTFIDLTGCTSSAITNVKAGSFAQIGTPEYGLKLGSTTHCRFENCEATGAFSVAAMGYSGGSASSNIWKSCTGSASGGGVPWLLQSSAPTEYHVPDIFLNCYPTDGGATLANLPAVPTSFGCTALCTDSTAPAWTGSVSNVGKPVVGGGSYRVTVRYGTVAPTLAATASWTTSTPNITMTSNPGTVTAGMGVIDVTNGGYVGKVSTYVGTALVLTSNALTASTGSADNLVFGTWCIAG